MPIVQIQSGAKLNVGSSSRLGIGGEDIPFPTLSGHWDFSDASTLFLDAARTMPVTTNGDIIRGVTDLSGSGNHLDDNSGASSGLDYLTGIKNGLSVAGNIGSSTKYLETPLNLSSPHSFVVVGKIPSAPLDGASGHSLISADNTSGGQSTNIQLIPTASRYYSTGSSFVISTLETPPTADVWHIWVFNMDGVLNPIYLENTFDVNNAAGALARTDGFRFMHDENLGGGSWGSYGAEVYMYSGALSDAARVSLVSDLKTKWDI